MDSLYFQVFIQWAFFFLLMALFLVPAMRFRRIALKNNQKGWQHFLFGIGIGIAWLMVLRLISFLFMRYARTTSDQKTVVAFIILAACIVGAYFTVVYAARGMNRGNR